MYTAEKNTVTRKFAKKERKETSKTHFKFHEIHKDEKKREHMKTTRQRKRKNRNKTKKKKKERNTMEKICLRKYKYPNCKTERGIRRLWGGGEGQCGWSEGRKAGKETRGEERREGTRR